ncbi:MAG: phosphoglycerate kinase [Patescibacteria group bacterium]|jgi:phosphoglycerate kinase
MKLRVLPASMSLKGKRVIVRVDWNIPIAGKGTEEDSLKMERSFDTIRDFAKRGAVVLLLTHLGRPKKRDVAHSTKKLAHIASVLSGLKIHFVGEAVDDKKDLAKLAKAVQSAKNGSIFLLENVRFLKGEEQNDLKLAKAYASLGDVFVNDAFASCHRAHVSVVGIAKQLPAYAGASLANEVAGLERLLKKPKKPFLAVIGGSKLSTKIDVLTKLLSIADRVLVGGAMAHAFYAAKKMQIGKSYVEKSGIVAARKLLKHPKLVLPVDAVVAKTIDAKAHPYVVPVHKVKKQEMIGDIGTETMMAWSDEIKRAGTIVWNGPLGVTEYGAFSHGSLVIARAIAARSKGKCYGVVGGGDTLPIVLQSGMSEWIDHLSTGGGAMLEFMTMAGKLPGLEALAASKK